MVEGKREIVRHAFKQKKYIVFILSVAIESSFFISNFKEKIKLKSGKIIGLVNKITIIFS